MCEEVTAMELWDAYDRNGRRTGETLVRGKPIPEGRYHLVSCVTVRHRDGSFLLMRRSPDKPNWPNIWEIGAGGSALKGETAEECARRELYEETGISCGNLTYLGRYREGVHIYEGFLCVTDHPKDQIRLQKGENVDYRWLTVPEFLEFFDSDQCIEKFKRRLGSYVSQFR